MQDDFDYLAAEGAIVARLQAAVSALEDVRGEASFTALKESALRGISAAVIYAGDRLVEGTQSTALVEQTWCVVLAVKSYGDKTGEKARATAGTVLTQMLKALQGFEPGERFTPLVRVNAPSPEMLPGGTLFLPLAFKTQLAL